MPRKPSIHVVPISIKVAQSILDDAELAAKNSPDAGFTSVTRTDMLRFAMRRGLDAILSEQHQQPIVLAAANAVHLGQPQLGQNRLQRLQDPITLEQPGGVLSEQLAPPVDRDVIS
jgi:hypothetical protein